MSFSHFTANLWKYAWVTECLDLQSVIPDPPTTHLKRMSSCQLLCPIPVKNQGMQSKAKHPGIIHGKLCRSTSSQNHFDLERKAVMSRTPLKVIVYTHMLWQNSNTTNPTQVADAHVFAWTFPVKQSSPHLLASLFSGLIDHRVIKVLPSI